MESKRERDDEAAAHVMAEEGSGRDGRGEGEKIWVRRRRDDIVPPAAWECVGRHGGRLDQACVRLVFFSPFFAGHRREGGVSVIAIDEGGGISMSRGGGSRRWDSLYLPAS